jgi:hypothetical protein
MPMIFFSFTEFHCTVIIAADMISQETTLHKAVVTHYVDGMTELCWPSGGVIILR